MTKPIDRDRLGDLTKLNRGGQGIVYDAPAVKTKFAAAMVYKEYTPQSLRDMDPDTLSAMPGFLESLPYEAGKRLISLATWPCATVEVNGAVTGFVMPRIPDDFYISLTTVKGATRTLAEFQHLLNPRHFLDKLGIAITDEQRCALLREVASALTFLHNNNICVGDISPKNLLFSLTPPKVHFLDCDAMRVAGESVLPQAETPNWWVPNGEEKATPYSDTYKLGLLALRVFAGEQHLKDPKSLPASSPTLLRQLVTDTLTRAADSRPSPEAWTQILGRVVEDIQHQEDQSEATPNTTVVASAPTPPRLDTQAYALQASAVPRPVPFPAATARAPLRQPTKTGSSALKTLGLLGAALLFIIIIMVPVLMDLAKLSTNIHTNSGAYTPHTTPYAAAPTPSYTKTTTPSWSTTTTTTPRPRTPVTKLNWDGIWARDYTEHDGDCDYGLNYWVVQPGNDTGMSALKLGCFPTRVVGDLNDKGHALSWWTAVIFAVWDPGRIMSEYEKTGDLQMIGLAKSCLARAGLTDFHEGPIHDDCLVKPKV